MDIPQLLLPLRLRDHVEVVIARLPERTPRAAPSQSPRHQLLQHLNRGAEFVLAWFAYQEVNMFRHDHVPEHVEAIPSANVFKYTLKRLFRAIGVEQRQPTVTAKSQEVVAAEVLITFEMRRHARRVTRFSVPECDARRWPVSLSDPTLTSNEG